LNLIPEGGSANYLVTGFWGARTHKESRKYGDINLVHEIVKGIFAFGKLIHSFLWRFKFLTVFSLLDMNYIPDEKDWNINTKGSYFHYTDNETLSGLEFKDAPYAQG